jgi:A/G-specific adenine glycosylase
MSMSEHEIAVFKETVWEYYNQHSRQLPWRQIDNDGTIDPYRVMVSEMMLQQTQVQRVIQKYAQFLDTFPDIESLAGARLGEVLQVWTGLGYNRRAKYIWQSSQLINDNFRGTFPQTTEALVALPGIGYNTAAAILTYSYNRPHVFVETNIRTVFIYHFFSEGVKVHDRELLELVASSLDDENPREWYWALMDYGSWLKKTAGNYSKYSKQYVKQSPFKGSDRQLRGKILRLLSKRPYETDVLLETLQDARGRTVLETLVREELVSKQGNRVRLP